MTTWSLEAASIYVLFQDKRRTAVAVGGRRNNDGADARGNSHPRRYLVACWPRGSYRKLRPRLLSCRAPSMDA